MFFLLCASAIINVFDNFADVKITEIRYRYSIDSYNPLYHIWFFLFESENREFLWKEKDGFDEKSSSREIMFSNKSCVVADFFSQNGEFKATVDFGGKEWKGKLNLEQTKTWFDMLDFSRSAKPGDVYQADYKTNKNEYRISITAQRFVTLVLADKSINTFYFKGHIDKKTEKFLGVQFWIAQEGKLKGQLVQCSFKKKFWPLVTIKAVN